MDFVDLFDLVGLTFVGTVSYLIGIRNGADRRDREWINHYHLDGECR